MSNCYFAGQFIVIPLKLKQLKLWVLVTYLAGNENTWIAIPDTVMESLLSASCEPGEVVHQLKLSLQWDQASLEDPTPENKRLIRYLATKAKHSNRLDVVKHLREITPAGTAGELQESCIVLFRGQTVA